MSYQTVNSGVGSLPLSLMLSHHMHCLDWGCMRGQKTLQKRAWVCFVNASPLIKSAIAKHAMGILAMQSTKSRIADFHGLPVTSLSKLPPNTQLLVHGKPLPLHTYTQLGGIRYTSVYVVLQLPVLSCVFIAWDMGIVLVHSVYSTEKCIRRMVILLQW